MSSLLNADKKPLLKLGVPHGPEHRLFHAQVGHNAIRICESAAMRNGEHA